MIQIDVSIIITNPVYQMLPLHSFEEFDSWNRLQRIWDCSRFVCRLTTSRQNPDNADYTRSLLRRSGLRRCRKYFDHLIQMRSNGTRYLDRGTVLSLVLNRELF